MSVWRTRNKYTHRKIIIEEFSLIERLETIVEKINNSDFFLKRFPHYKLKVEETFLVVVNTKGDLKEDLLFRFKVVTDEDNYVYITYTTKYLYSLVTWSKYKRYCRAIAVYFTRNEEKDFTLRNNTWKIKKPF